MTAATPCDHKWQLSHARSDYGCRYRIFCCATCKWLKTESA
jgi:hypothetical protein